jgi:RNA polymerase sigma-70 factor (ECF subfamily)
MAAAQAMDALGKQREVETDLVRLYESSYEGLFRYAMTLTRDKDTARDNVQECFLRYVVARRQGKSILNDRAWLYRVLRNRILDLRKSSAWSTSVGIEHAAGCADRRPGPEEQLRGLELSEALWEVLSARELECLQLRVEGMTYLEIAEVMHVKGGTVAATLARALQKAHRLLAPYGRDAR